MFSVNIVAQILPLVNSSIMTCSFVIRYAQEGLKHLLIIFFHGILFFMPPGEDQDHILSISTLSLQNAVLGIHRK